MKTFTIALRLAIFSYLKQTGGITPVLLLDDIFDKLDSTRVARIMNEVSQGERLRPDIHNRHKPRAP